MEIDLETKEELLNRDELSEDIEDCVGAWEVELLDENVRDVCDVVGKEDCTGVVTTVVGACNGVWIFMYGNFHLWGQIKFIVQPSWKLS